MTDTAQKMFQPLSQEEAAYNPAGGETNRACSNCRWFIANGWTGDGMANCALVETWPEPIVANGVCNRHEVAPGYEPEPLEVVIVDVGIDVEVEGDDTPVGEMSLKRLVAIVKDVAQSIISPEQPSFQVFKTKNGRKGWIARHTGKFVDRHEEILADKAHDEYVERVEKGLVELPGLWTFHTKGTKHGDAFAVWRAGGFTLAAGLFDNTPEGDHAFAYYQKHAGEITLSHGFYYPTSAKRDGVYYAYNTFEISTLLEGEEAFPYTSFEEIEAMALTEVQKERIREVGGDSMLRRAEAASNKAEVDTKALEGGGVAYKGHDSFDGATIPASTDEVVKTILGDFESRLKELAALPDTIKALQDQATEDRKTIVALRDQVTAAQEAETKLLEQVNSLQKQLVEYAALKPPATQSDDTLLNEREKALLDKVMEKSNADAQPSLVDTLVGGKTAISPNGGAQQ